MLFSGPTTRSSAREPATDGTGKHLTNVGHNKYELESGATDKKKWHIDRGNAYTESKAIE
jgi:hypothetical protein